MINKCLGNLEIKCDEFKRVLKEELIHKPGIILDYGDGKVGNQKVTKKYFIGDKYNPLYINNCPFCGENLNKYGNRNENKIT